MKRKNNNVPSSQITNRTIRKLNSNLNRAYKRNMMIMTF